MLLCEMHVIFLFFYLTCFFGFILNICVVFFSSSERVCKRSFCFRKDESEWLKIVLVFFFLLFLVIEFSPSPSFPLLLRSIDRLLNIRIVKLETAMKKIWDGMNSISCHTLHRMMMMKYEMWKVNDSSAKGAERR